MPRMTPPKTFPRRFAWCGIMSSASSRREAETGFSSMVGEILESIPLRRNLAVLLLEDEVEEELLEGEVVARVLVLLMLEVAEDVEDAATLLGRVSLAAAAAGRRLLRPALPRHDGAVVPAERDGDGAVLELLLELGRLDEDRHARRVDLDELAVRVDVPAERRRVPRAHREHVAHERVAGRGGHDRDRERVLADLLVEVDRALEDLGEEELELPVGGEEVAAAIDELADLGELGLAVRIEPRV